MSQICTAQFITDSGFATGLTPTVTITEALTGLEKGVFTMNEVSSGNYLYDFGAGNDETIYFFKYDAGTDTVVNRYQGNTNKVENTVAVRGGGGGVVYNNSISKEKMKEIADMVVKMLPEQKELVLDMSKIEEKLGTIEDKIDSSEIEFDYDTIISSNEKNTQKILKSIDKIKIPKYDEMSIKEEIKSIPKVDTKPLEDKIDGINNKIDKMKNEHEEKKETHNKEKIEKLKEIQVQLKEIKVEIEDTIDEEEPKELPDVSKLHEEMMGKLNEDESFKSLLKEDE